MPKLSRGGGGPSELGKWMRNNGPALLMLTFVFLLALFIRSYFAYEMSADNDYIVSGGSDSYYWSRIIDYHVDTGQNLFRDPLLNYPDNLINPRPPLFSMSVAVPAVLLQGLFDSVEDATGFFFVWSTAFWGALTVVPVYFLGKEIFGRRVGMASALFFAIVPAHVQRSVLSNADHDAIILFLIVTIFYFLLKAIRAQEHKRWVESWKSRSSVMSGFRNYLGGSRNALLYALMAGTAYAALMVTWVGFAYVTVIILVYYVIQLFVNMFRYQDSMSITMLILVMMSFGYLLAFPYYANYFNSFFNDRFLVPLLLSAGGLFFGSMFVVSRDYPWTISLPTIAGISVAVVGGLSVFYPWLGEAILTGQGYFSTSKLYSTIAEARPPQFSELALSFGMVTFFMSLAGLLYAITRIPKRTGAEYIFMVVWLAAAIFMAISAARFMFNAAPAFAIAAGWVFVVIVDALDFNSVRKSLTGASGSIVTILRKSIKIRHVVGVLFLGFLILLPNIWYSVDAGIPSESKRSYDKDVYFSMPSFMRPGEYDELNGSNWYLGAFGYSLPLPSYYYPAAWDWFSEQDSDVFPESARPAYVAWWDYGFEAVAEGKHPTVADNFQNGYQFTGNAIMAQSEQDTIALFAFRLVQGAIRLGGDSEAGVVSVMDKYGVDSGRMYEILLGAGQPVIDEVLSDPDEYGPMSPDMSVTNARIVAGRVELAKVGMDSLVGMYDELCAVTGWEIRYFNVDSRMFPISAYETGIFYAPAKLSDRRLYDSTPIDFYTIKAVDSNGVEHDLEDVTARMSITSYNIVYQDMFYDSMFYRAMCGISGSDIGMADGDLPGVSGAVQKVSPMPGWNLTHFKMVYRTAYYNPYPSSEVAFHSKEWRAVSYDEAMELNTKISSGEVTGVIDYSASSLYRSGTVFLKYYHGAYVNGTVTTESGYPAEGLWVTVQDEYGIPHQQVRTDSEGRYSVLAPFGNVTVVISEGPARNQGLVGGTVVTRMKFNVTDDQAMRIRQDLDGDGVFDYIFTKDHVMKDSKVSGDIYWDNDAEGNFTAGTDDFITDAMVYAVDTESGMTYEFDAPDGSYEGYLPPGQYDLYALAIGANLTISSGLNVTANSQEEASLAVRPATIGGYATNPDGSPAALLTLVLDDVVSDAEFSTVTTAEGVYHFPQVLSSKYLMTTTADGKMLFDERIAVSASYAEYRNVTVWDKCTVDIRVTSDGVPAAYAAYSITDDYDPSEVISGITDRYGWVRADLRSGEFTLRAVYSTGSGSRAGQMSIDLTEASEQSGVLPVYESFMVSGIVTDADDRAVGVQYMTFVASSGARVVTRTDISGAFGLPLPQGEYGVVISSSLKASVYAASLTVSSDMSGLTMKLSEGYKMNGYLYEDVDGDLEPSSYELAPFANVRATDSNGFVFTAKSASDAAFALVLPKGDPVTLTVADPGYSSWSTDVAYDQDTYDVILLVAADPVKVTGTLAVDGVGLSGIVISFVPANGALPTVETLSGAYGRYSASVIPSVYKVVVNEELDNTPGAWYQHESSLIVSPSGSALLLDIDAVLRVQVHGSVLGAAQDVVLQFNGPEEVSLDVTSFSYSLYLMPGTYSVYGTGSIDSTPQACMESIEVSPVEAEHDFVLERAYRLSGLIRFSDSAVRDPVTVTVTSDQGVQVVDESTRYGYYELSLPTGLYVLSFLLDEVEHLESLSWYLEHSQEIIYALGPYDSTVDVVLTTRLDNVTLQGTVYDENGNPISATIQLVPLDRYGMYASFSTTSSGSFSAKVQPGEYTMYVTRSVDTRVSVSHLLINWNTDVTQDAHLSIGRYIQGRLTVAGIPSVETVKVTSTETKLTTRTSSDGYFQFLLPSGNHTVSASTVRTENGVAVTYALTQKVTLEDSNKYLDFALLRDTKHSVKGSWDANRTATLSPGQTVSYVISLENTGNVADTYTFRYSGTDFTASFEPSEVWIDFGSGGNTAYVVVTLTVSGTAEAGNRTASVTIVSNAQSSARTTVDLVAKVLPVRSVAVESLNTSAPISSNVTTTKFIVNNTGNIEGDFMLSVSNTDTLRTSGWSARVVDPGTGKEVKNVTLGAFETKELAVEFTAIRPTPDPKVGAVVVAYSSSDPTVTGSGAVPVMLSDLVIGPGGLEVVRDDITYEYDVGRLYMDIGLAVALAALVVTFFVLRKRKGLGGGGKK